eukprot:3815272-Rhodomonas_salina.2
MSARSVPCCTRPAHGCDLSLEHGRAGSAAAWCQSCRDEPDKSLNQRVVCRIGLVNPSIRDMNDKVAPSPLPPFPPLSHPLLSLSLSPPPAFTCIPSHAPDPAVMRRVGVFGPNQLAPHWIQCALSDLRPCLCVWQITSVANTVFSLAVLLTLENGNDSGIVSSMVLTLVQLIFQMTSAPRPSPSKSDTS